MGRILAIDYGRKRVGLAVTDPLRITANGLDTVPTHKLFEYLAAYLQKEQVDLFVVGEPKQMNHTDSESMSYIRPFVQKLRNTFPDREVVLVDERFTSVLAQRTMREAGLKKSDRQDKALVDKVAATIILQTYLESLDPFANLKL